jgi:hypothetical protein
VKPLFDDPAISPELRADLLGSRRAGEDYDVLAKLPQLQAALADAARGTSEPPTAAAGKDVAATSRLPWAKLHVTPWAWKITVVAVIGAASLFAAWFAAWSAHRQEQPPPTQPQAAPAATAPAPIVTVVAPVAEPPSPPEQRAIVSEKLAPNPTPATRSSRREIDQLVRIRTLLESDPTAAYRLARRSQQEFPQGVLSEERQALEILALVKAGSANTAERKLRQFLARYPESPMRVQLESDLKR